MVWKDRINAGAFFPSLTRRPWWCVLATVLLILSLPLMPDALVWILRAVLLVLVLALARRLIDAVRNPKPLVFGLVAIAMGLSIAYGLLELVCWVYLVKAPVTGSPLVLSERQKKAVQSVVDGAVGYQVYSPSLAWTIEKNQTSKEGLYRSNAQGFRADREYTKEIPPGKIRVLCFGDSFTHCDEVANDETWTHHAEKAAPDMEFLNFGVPGYGLTQAFLRYTEVADEFQADYVIIGCMTEDTKRSVNVYYPFRYANPEDSPNAFALPYASLDKKGRLEINPPFLKNREAYAAFLQNPLPKLKQMSRVDILLRSQPATPLLTLLDDRRESIEPVADYFLASWARIYRPQGKFRSTQEREGLRNGERRRLITEINNRLFMHFVRAVRKNGAVPLIMWFPSPTNLKHHNDDKKRSYAPHFEFFKAKGLAAVDTLDWLEEAHGKDGDLPVKGLLENVHFSVEANALIGKRIAEHIRAMDEKAKIRVAQDAAPAAGRKKNSTD